MNIQTIIDEADIRVPNVFTAAQKVDWLNEVNFEFFDIVKIPKTYTQTVYGTTGSFTMPADMKEKNIKKVVSGSSYYRSMNYENVHAAFNHYVLEDSTRTLTMTPKPLPGKIVVVYDQMSVTPFLAGNLTVEPEAPAEYHWLYILGLCVRMAKAMNDVGLANNYENDYRSNLIIAQQNYIRKEG